MSPVPPEAGGGPSGASRPLRVAFDVTYALSPRTGVGAFAHAMLERLAADPAIDVTGFAVAWRHRDRVLAELPPGVRVPARTDVLSPRHARAAWKRWAFPPIELVTGPVDVVHSPNYVVPPARRAATVVTVHDLTFVNHPELCTDDTRSFPRLIEAAVRRGAWVHTVSRFVADEVMGAFDVPAERVVVVPNATDPLEAGTAAEGHALAGGDRYVLAIGTVEPRKNLPRLVAAWQQVADEDPELRLVIAGGDGWGAAELDGALVTARHTDRIVRLGRVDDHQRAALYRGATVLAYASLYEGFGIPPLEAMSVGTPVVASRAGALPETCGDAARYVDPFDVDDLAAALAEVTGDEAVAADLARRGRARVAEFSWDASAAQLVALYRRAAGR